MVFKHPPVSRKIRPKLRPNLSPTHPFAFFWVWMPSLNLRLLKTQRHRKMRLKTSLLARSIFFCLSTPRGHLPLLCQTYHGLQQSGFGCWLRELPLRAWLLSLSALKGQPQEGQGQGHHLLSCLGEESPAGMQSPWVFSELSWSPCQRAAARPAR